MRKINLILQLNEKQNNMNYFKNMNIKFNIK